MPAVSQAEGEPPDTAPDTPGSGHSPGAAVLAAERSYLLESREFLQLMREDVLSPLRGALDAMKERSLPLPGGCWKL